MASSWKPKISRASRTSGIRRYDHDLYHVYFHGQAAGAGLLCFLPCAKAALSEDIRQEYEDSG